MKAVTDTKYYDEIARKIQFCAGSYSRSSYKPSELAEGVLTVSSYQYEDGHYYGYIEGEEIGWNDGYGVGYGEGEAQGLVDGNVQGREAQYDEFWDNYQKNGEKGYYVRAFQGSRWTDITFNPKYDILASNLQACFHSNSQITRIPVLVDVSTSSNMSQAFYGCSALTQLRLKVSEDTPFASNTFQACYALTDLSLEGTVGQSLDLSDCSQLSETTLANIVDNLATVSVATTLTLHAAAKKKLTDSQKAIIEEKGWSLA